MNLSQRLRLVSLDKKQWQRLYYKNQQTYIRQRLSAIRYLSEGKIIVEVIKQKWEVDLKTSRIYEILDNLNLSHQKAHRDYDNADPEKQKKFVKVLKKNAPEKAWGENSIL